MGLYKMSGFCKGIVVSTEDPAGFNRVRVRIPELHGPVNPDIYPSEQAKKKYWVEDTYLPWAEVSYPFGDTTLPEINQVVLVGFFNGASDQPVILGWLGYEYTDEEDMFSHQSTESL